jgi:hypothetical protein
MAPLDPRVPPDSEKDLREAFRSPSVTHLLELAARDIVRRSNHLASDSQGHAIYDGRMSATHPIEVFDPHLQRAVRCKVRIRITVEPDMEQLLAEAIPDR